MKLSRSSTVAVLVGLAVGALSSGWFWYRDGFEVAGWIAGFVVAAMALVIALPARLISPQAPTQTTRAGSLLVMLRHRWVKTPATTTLVAAATVGVVAFVQRPPQPPSSPPATSRESAPSAGDNPLPSMRGTATARHRPRITVSTSTVAAGGGVTVSGAGFLPGEVVRVELYEGSDLRHFDGPYLIGSRQVDSSGSLTSIRVTIPLEICCRGAKVRLTVAGEQSHGVAEHLVSIG